MGASELLERIEGERDQLPAEQEYRWLLALEGVLDRTVRWAVENLPEDVEVGGVIDRFQGPVAELCDILPSIVRGSNRAAFEETLEELKAFQLPALLAVAAFVGPARLIDNRILR